MINRKKIEKEIKKNQVCFVVIPRKMSFDISSQVKDNGNSQVENKDDNDDRVSLSIGSDDQLPIEIEKFIDEYKEIMIEYVLDSLFLVRIISHCTDLILGASFLNKAPYRLTPIKNEDIKKQVQELLWKGLIREILTNPRIAPILLEPKKKREWIMCSDSRAINKIIVKYRFPMPRMDDIIDCLSGINYFTKTDFKSGYHHIRTREGDE